MRYLKISLVILALSWVVDNPVHALSGESAKESLKGLPGVWVVVEKITPEAEADGLSESQIQTDVELVLRASGIRVLTMQEALATPSMPYLYIDVSTIKPTGKEFYAYSVSVELAQRVSLVNLKKKETIYAVTWSWSMVGSSGKENLHQTRKFIEDMIKKFANDFLAANPR